MKITTCFCCASSINRSAIISFLLWSRDETGSSNTIQTLFLFIEVSDKKFAKAIARCSPSLSMSIGFFSCMVNLFKVVPFLPLCLISAEKLAFNFWHSLLNVSIYVSVTYLENKLFCFEVIERVLIFILLALSTHSLLFIKSSILGSNFSTFNLSLNSFSLICSSSISFFTLSSSRFSIKLFKLFITFSISL